MFYDASLNGRNHVYYYNIQLNGLELLVIFDCLNVFHHMPWIICPIIFERFSAFNSDWFQSYWVMHIDFDQDRLGSRNIDYGSDILMVSTI